jgi:adenosylcobinamide kinase/adenosylcobinamide-phosphate guanylyltransferase
MGRVVLITGGARCGKSSYALKLALENRGPRVFIATAEPADEEMRRRIERHRKEREGSFTTIEEPVDLDRALLSVPEGTGVAVIDCLTVWLGNLYHRCGSGNGRINEKISKLLETAVTVRFDLIVVTNEVGWGIVPDNALSRSYRDLLGELNRRFAETAAAVYFLCCGIPIQIKGAV